MNKEKGLGKLIRRGAYFTGCGAAIIGNIFGAIPVKAEAPTGNLGVGSVQGSVNCNTTEFSNKWNEVGNTRNDSYRGDFDSSRVFFGLEPEQVYWRFDTNDIVAIQECTLPQAGQQEPVTTVFLVDRRYGNAPQASYQYTGNPPSLRGSNTSR